MIEKIIDSTNLYLETMPKQERKKYGQFFTSKETALFMAGLYNVPDSKDYLSILDAGAGSGMLACALIETLQGKENLKKIALTCYENDINILELLRSNLNQIKENSKIEIEYNILTDNYITSQHFDFNEMQGCNITEKKYDIVIGNPPYMKISKDAPEATAMPEVCYGAPNLYFLFASMSLFNLKDDGEMVYIIPRSWTSGAYFNRFRQYLLTKGKLEHIHLFVSRKKVFDKEDVLQETIIIKVIKTCNEPQTLTITSSHSNHDFHDLKTLKIPYSIAVSGENKYVYLVTDEDEVNTLMKINKWKNTLPSLGIKMKTGLTVDFRNREILRDVMEEGAVPLFYSQHIREGTVEFPINKENEFVVTEQSGLIQKNKNYLFVKRFTAKEEKRRLQCGIYLSKRYPQYEKISTQNKINFVDGLTSELSECEVYGLYALFNSTVYDTYYRVLNGSTQVNSTEINSMPVPSREIIRQLGKALIKSNDLSEENCDRILEEYYA
ncbi:MAG: Restriction modification methylase Eco57I [Bacillota bacterium]|jgi:adenine-specific DNA-methyltransferase|nr:Restriction modification methylase Eco57I [Bacillota bacterium]